MTHRRKTAERNDARVDGRGRPPHRLPDRPSAPGTLRLSAQHSSVRILPGEASQLAGSPMPRKRSEAWLRCCSTTRTTTRRSKSGGNLWMPGSAARSCSTVPASASGAARRRMPRCSIMPRCSVRRAQYRSGFRRGAAQLGACVDDPGQRIRGALVLAQGGHR